MKKHPFLTVEYQSSVKLTASEDRQIKKWLNIASIVLEKLFKNEIIQAKKLKTLEVSLLICGDSRIKDLNRQYRQKDKVTDVLSFPAHENLRDSIYQFDNLFLGDLAICHAQTKRQAKEFGISYMDEFIHLFFHGVIHLLGFDHEISAKEEELMQAWENLALTEFSKAKKKAR